MERRNMLADDDVQAVQKLSTAYRRIIDELGRVIVGQRQVIEELLIAHVRPRALPAAWACRAWPRR